MRFENCTLGYVKDLYRQKVKAKQENDEEKIKYLSEVFPEIFDTKFLMDIFRNEIERLINGLDDTMIVKFHLFHYH